MDIKRKRSQAAKDATIATFGERARVLAEGKRYRQTLVEITEVYDMRADLFTSDEECAGSLADRARAALKPQS